MAEYTIKDVIIDPEDSRAEVGKKYYFSLGAQDCVDRANRDSRAAELLAIDKSGEYHPFISDGEKDYPFIIRKKELSYAERQEKWIKENNLKVGDLVRVTRKADSHEDGWTNLWAQDMDKAVGEVGTVSHIPSDFRECSIEVDVLGIGLFLYPYFVLEKVKQKYVPFDLSNPEVRKSLRGRWIKNKNNNFELCITFFTHQGYVGNTIPADVYMVSGIDADELFQYWVFEDGSPCGKRVEEVENE